MGRVTDTPRRIVVVGASQAGLAASRELRKRGFDDAITVLDAEDGGPYRRPEVSKGLLSGAFDAAGVAVRLPEELELDLRTGATAVGLDPGRRTVRVRTGETVDDLPYDGLVVATGALARPPLGAAPAGVHTLRTLADAHAMRADLIRASSLVVVGGGFIGLEVASVARGLGIRVTVLELADLPLAGVLGKDFGEHLARVHREGGVDLRCGIAMEGWDVGADGHVRGVATSGGSVVPGDLVLLATGSLPATGWLDGSGADCSAGLRCDATCAVEGLPAVVAAGDVASWWNPLYDRRMRVEHWTNAIEQGGFAARRLLDEHDPGGFVSAPYFWSDQWGTRIQSIGSTGGHDEAVVIEQDSDRILVAYGSAGRLVAVAGMNAGPAVNRYRKPILERATLRSVTDREVA